MNVRSENSCYCPASTSLACSALPHGPEFQEGKSRGTEDRPALEWLPLGNSASPGQQSRLKVGSHFLFILDKVSKKSSRTASKYNVFIEFQSVQSLLSCSYNVLSFCFAVLPAMACFRNWCFWQIFKPSFEINTFLKR